MVLLVALAAPRAEAQPNPIQPNPTQRQVRPSEGRAAFSVREAPENLVYRIFFAEFIGSQRAADQRRDQGKDDAELRTLFQRRLRLNEFEHHSLVSAAQTVAAVWDANNRSRQELSAKLRLAQDKPPLRAKLAELAQGDETAVADAVVQLRSTLGAGRFAEMDWMIRVHVVPSLKVAPASRRTATATGGQ